MNDVILVGNPNTGKTTLFNNLTSSSEHTGNWHGVTVDSKAKKYKYNNQHFNVVDLPGIYSLSAFSFEEQVSINYIYSHQNSLIVNIVDINSIYKNLYLTQELLMLNIPMILVINQTLKQSNCVFKLNEKLLENNLNIKVLKINFKNKKEINKLKNEIFNFYNKKQQKTNNYILNNKELKQILHKTTQLIKNNCEYNINYCSLKCLENDDEIIKKLKLSSQQKIELNNLQKQVNIEQIIKIKYEQIDKLLNDSKTIKTKNVYGKSKLDTFVLNKILAIPIFLIVLLFVFYLTFFSVGKYCSNLLSDLVQNVFGGWLLNAIKGITSNAIIIDFFSSAIIGGIGTIFSFLPQIVIMFVCLGILEDSGYLSRVAFSLDDIFSRVGLSGKSVYTLLMGFGCSTTACLTARTMEDKNSKIKTAMLAPYMSCSAKLPIYAVIGSAFFGASNVFVIFAMYMLGVVVALLLSVFYEKTFLKSKEQAFILEFPPYRIPTIKRLGSIAYNNLKMFVSRVVTVLISVNIIVWVLSNFSFTFSFIPIDGGMSILQTIGKLLAPIFVPLGFGSWGATSALIAGLIAKEIIVSSIAMINGIALNSQNFNEQISRSLTFAASAICFTPASAISYMVFCLLYSPCLATISVLKKELGKKWTFVSIVLQFTLAYVISLILYNSVNLIYSKGILAFISFVVTFGLILYSTVLLIKKILNKHKCKNCKFCKKI
ncbi:MAG: ferrous iron transport protein B [Clostridiales bacterium]|nr:ferrous iron transport protein B [Clostridiales bacterium]